MTKNIKESVNYNPIIMGGAGRSGTTLLRVMLNAHPNLCSGPEFKLFPSIINLYMQCKKFGGIMEAYSQDLSDIQNSFREFIYSFFEKHIEESKAKRLVEKTPHNVLIMKELCEIFPDAKFIHVIRDGRDVASSLLKMNWVDFNGNKVPYTQNIKKAAAYWNQIVAKAISDSNTSYLNNKVYTVKYEDLILNTEQTLKDILSFLNEPWNEKILDYHKIERGYEPKESSTDQVSKNLYSKSIKRWEKEFSESDKKDFKEEAGKLLIELGYEKDMNW
ncbi:MAG: sulfotransferase [Firmicutes bacterium]|nr:sulfotransferase [Bacillota bacterium]